MKEPVEAQDHRERKIGEAVLLIYITLLSTPLSSVGAKRMALPLWEGINC